MKRLIAAILIMLSVTGAKAGPDSDLLAKMGLLGAWATDCSRPPSEKNPYTVFAPSTSGFPTRVLQMDTPSLDRTSEIREVRLLENNRVRFFMQGSNATDNRYITLVVLGNRHRSLDAADVNGKKYVADGKYVGVSGETPWFQKCGG